MGGEVDGRGYASFQTFLVGDHETQVMVALSRAVVHASMTLLSHGSCYVTMCNFAAGLHENFLQGEHFSNEMNANIVQQKL